MKVRMGSLIICLLLCSIVHAKQCGESIDFQFIKKTVNELRSEYRQFDSLKKSNIQFVSFKSEGYFLATGIKKLLKKKGRRVYVIKINERLYDCPPSKLAMKAILAHELFHIVDYQKRSRWGMLGFGTKYAFSPKKIERATDFKTIQLGLAQGLSEYRTWIYQFLNPKQLKRKRKRYYTPKELEIYTNN